MHTTRHSWLSAAHGAAWFQLTRHDDPDPADPPEPKDPADPPEAKDPDPDPDPEGADKLGDAGKKALDKMKADKAAAKREAAAEKKRADELAAKVAEFQDRDKTELERATAKADAAAKKAEAANARALKAEVKVAASDFADPEDAIAFLDLTSLADDSGEVDTDALTTALEELLKRKPHLRKQEQDPDKDKDPDKDPKKGPKPDPSQGPRKDPPPADWRKADRKDVEAELAKYGVRLRR